jgi:dipeptidyl aminopeptidase/acylaminoacyl peptidase
MPPSRRLRPYGLWTSTLHPADAAQDLRFSDLAWGPENQLLWLEERSDRGVVVACEVSSGRCTDLTPDSLPVRARIGYGGGEFAVGTRELFFVSGDCIYRTSLHLPSHPTTLTSDTASAAAPYLSPSEDFLVCVFSSKGADSIRIVDTRGRRTPQLLDEGHAFYMQPRWHPARPLLAWVAWDDPNMPWDGSGLYLMDLNKDSSAQLIAGDPTGQVAITQPEFSPDGRLLAFVSDEGGWFNLRVLELETGKIVSSLNEPAEHAGPAWVQGMRTFTWAADSRSLFLIRSQNSFQSLGRFHVDSGKLVAIEGEISNYSAFRQPCLTGRDERIAVLASSAQIPSQVITLDEEARLVVHRSSSARPPATSHLSRAKPIQWKANRGADADPTHQEPVSTCYGLYYAPCNPNFYSTGLPPGLIRVHGGPTGQYLADYHAETQFLCSRGFAVLELNYRGSSGYGREYRDSLKGRWGVSDVDDLRDAARFLTAQGLADPTRIAAMGGSAGGFTVLHALIRFPRVFKAGICLYPVCDLRATAEETHRFERFYLNSLIGDPADQESYASRSPLLQAGQIRDPVAVYHGTDDKVVPPSQSQALKVLLDQAGTPNLVVMYGGEAHGWRKSETLRAFYRSLEEFLSAYVVATTPDTARSEHG